MLMKDEKVGKEQASVLNICNAEHDDIDEISLATSVLAVNDSMLLLESDQSLVKPATADKEVAVKVNINKNTEEKNSADDNSLKSASGDLMDNMPDRKSGNDDAGNETRSRDASDDKKIEKKQAGLNNNQGNEFKELIQVSVPDILNVKAAEVIKIAVSRNDEVELDDNLVVLWTDKTSIDIRSPYAGKIKSVKVRIGDKVSQGDGLVQLQVDKNRDLSSTPATSSPSSQVSGKEPDQKQQNSPAEPELPSLPLTKEGYIEPSYSPFVLAGSGVRMLARDLGVDLSLVPATGPRGRTLKIDVENFVKNTMYWSSLNTQAPETSSLPHVEFSEFGSIEFVDMSQEQILITNNSQHSWMNVPSASHYDKADVTNLENFRGLKNKHAVEGDLKLTLLPFLLKACAVALRHYPQFNASLAPTGYQLIRKRYCNIGMAINTPEGLMTPVIRDVDKKGIRELAEETTDLGIRGQNGELQKEDLMGGCFTLSSFGSGSFGGLQDTDQTCIR